jgi:hypothetical protein
MSVVTRGGSAAQACSVSVVVPTRVRDVGLLRRCVEAVARDAAVTEVIVVLDGERAAQRASSLGGELGPDTRMCVVPGAGRRPNEARALGVANATGDVVLFLDDDVVAGPGLASGHLAHHQRRAGLVVVGSMPVAAEHRARSATARVYACDYERVCRSYDASNDAVLLDLWSGNLSVGRDDCLGVGLASQVFPYLQHEDREFGLRCRAAGLTGVFDRMLLGTHYYVRSTSEFLRLARQQVLENWTLHAHCTDVLGPWSPDTYRIGVPRHLWWLLRTRPVVIDPAEGGAKLTALRLVGRAAHTAHSRRLEDRALTLSRAVVQHTMAQQLLAEDARSGDSGEGSDASDQLAPSDAMPTVARCRTHTG